MVPWWKFLTGPMFKYALVLLIGGIVGWKACGWWELEPLQKRLYEREKAIAKLEVENSALQASAQAAHDGILSAEEQCRELLKREKAKPKQTIDTESDVTDDYLSRILGVRRDGGKDGGKDGATGARPDTGTPKGDKH